MSNNYMLILLVVNFNSDPIRCLSLASGAPTASPSGVLTPSAAKSHAWRRPGWCASRYRPGLTPPPPRESITRATQESPPRGSNGPGG